MEPSTPFYPSGIRLGTPALTTRGMKEEEMQQIGAIIAKVINEIKDCKLPDDKEARSAYIAKFRKHIKSNKAIKEQRRQVIAMCDAFPLYEGLRL